MKFKLLLIIIVATPILAVASEKKKEMSFDELLVKGKKHESLESTVTVENDKVLDALLQVRKDFKDRIKQSANRR